ncbi:MAG: hypothetical protein LBS74_09785 [Oscillospiraceae bacterium]|jgi:hypothetical protein|nr:hypothetical protein [Oscillospiraceae bacterium]
MSERIRTVQKKFYVTPDEADVIAQKMKQASMSNMGDYLRQMTIKGYIIEVDFSAVKEVTG